ncbi:DNA-processing protein DprA [Polymorphum gilvum]|uniref:DNA protecting protein DprA, putative n=1 Tax=Polymorphum gilvum (strain LMG 25793 / CGMCC 1.9160 / SL003B-26A1) TaxID=991905 RepID=F2IVZ1_POLGS|nr:DNA-processing protein DprA [Polymorphum gilvum]ADZ70273.1 DNA protecting protein DprA, putative [Polymorphum gilvum SL003B-26A1]
MSRGPEPAKTPRLSEAQRLAWLRLIRSENVGPSTFRALVNHFGSAERALDALPALSRRGGKPSIRVCPLHEAENEMRAHERAGSRLVALGETGYPPHLRHVDGPPPLLSVNGSDATLASPKTLAVVGARNASLSGRKIAATLARDLSGDGFVIVSGLARGIDAAAHEAALAGGTIAVFAGGIDILYPPEHDGLLARILDAGGSAISEMPFGWKPRGRDFPRRNRLISGLSLGVLVIEAARASGSLHTARFALEQNRDIFAVPGSPLDPRSEGANRLIQQGAMLITCARDVIQSLAGRIEPVLPFEGEISEPDQSAPPEPIEPTDSLRDRIVSALGPTPVEIDELIRFTGLPARTVHVVLLELELAGRLERHRGQQVSLVY